MPKPQDPPLEESPARARSVADGPRNEVESPDRRRLIRDAAAAVPVILTLSSGVARAAGSITCAVREANCDPPTTVRTPDGWMRWPKKKRGESGPVSPDNTGRLAHFTIDDYGHITLLSKNNCYGQPLTGSCLGSINGNLLL